MSGRFNAAKHAALVIFLTLLMILGGSVFRLWAIAIASLIFLWLASLVKNNWRGTAELVLLERATTFFARLIDSLMIYLLWTDHFVAELAICVPLYFVLCVCFVSIYDWRASRGIKLLSLEKLQEFKNIRLDRKNFSAYSSWLRDRILQWILRKNITLFLVGSVFFFDPNFVTLLLRKSSRSWLGDFIKITLPSVIYSTIAWTIIYILAIRGMWSYEEVIDNILRILFRAITC